MRLSVLALAALIPLLAACSTKTDVAVVDAAQAQLTPTVTSYQAMSFAPVANPSSQFGPIGAGDPVYDFGYYGRSYYKAIELPRSDADYVLEVTSEIFVPEGRSQFHLFFPSFVFLDAAKNAVPVVANQAPFVTLDDEGYRRTIRFILRHDTKARYVVIYASRDMIVSGEELPFGSSGGVVPVGGLFIPTGAPRAMVKGSQEGKLGITIRSPESLVKE